MTFVYEIVGYAIDGEAYCIDCSGEREERHGDPIFAGNESDHDLTCDSCGEVIIEGYKRDGGNCPHCGTSDPADLIPWSYETDEYPFEIGGYFCGNCGAVVETSDYDATILSIEED